MGKFKDPPVFSKRKGFARWKTEINAWKDVVEATNTIAAVAIGQVVALSLPESPEEGDLKGKVMDALGDTLKGAGGFKLLIDWMEAHLGTDSTTDTIDKIRLFMKFSRSEGQSVKEFITGFDAKYNAAIKSGLDKLPQCYLMWLVVENAEVSDMNHKLVMANIDLEDKETLYTQAKASLLKFTAGPCSRDRLGEEKDGVRVKNETYFTKFPGNWGQQRQPYRPQFPIGQQGPRPSFGRGRGGQGGASGGFTPRTQIRMPRNPLSKSGKQTVCDTCGSWTHFKRDCPYNPNATMYGQTQDEDDNIPDGVYAVDGEYEFVSEEPSSQPDKVDETPPQVGASGSDYVSSLVATLKDISCTDTVDTFYTSFHVLNAQIERPRHPGEAVLDTGCIESVGGHEWANGFIGSLHPNTREKIIVEPSKRRFKFGGGESRESLGTFHIPCSLSGHNILLKVDVVQQHDLPCLLSKRSMKRAGVNIDVVNDMVTMFGQQIKLGENEQGHYVINFDDFLYNGGDCAVLYSIHKDGPQPQLMADLKRIHFGLGHPSHTAFERMLKATGDFNKTVDIELNKLYQACDTCLKFRKSKPIPKVAPPLSSSVNDTVTLDLKICGRTGKVILYMIDDFSRYVVAELLPNKEGETIVKSFIDKWIMGTPYGPPKQIISDNGLEFINAKFRSMCEAFGIKHITTGAWSAHQNGLNERNHFTCDQIMNKIMDSNPKTQLKEALKQAVYTKNMMLNVHGFSPAQILTGKQPRMPGATADNAPPADESEVDSRAVEKSINLIQEARQAWAKTDNSNRLKRAMRVQPSNLEKYETGENVHYKFGKDARWHGPGKVIGQENKIIYIKHGGHIISTSQSRVYRPGPGHEQMVEDRQPQPDSQSGPVPGVPTGRVRRDSEVSTDSSLFSDADPASEAEEENRNNGDGGETPGREGVENQVIQAGSPESTARPDIERFQFRGDQLPAEAESELPRDAEAESELTRDAESDSDSEMERQKKVEKRKRDREREEKRKEKKRKEEKEQRSEQIRKEIYPKKGNWILYKEKDKNVWFRAQVKGKGMKASSKLPYYNITPEFENDKGVNLDDFDWCYDSPEKVKGKVIFDGASNSGQSPNSSSDKRRGKGSKPTESSSPRLRPRRQEDVNTFLTYYTYQDQIGRAKKAEIEDTTYVVFIPKEDWKKPFVKEAKEKELNNFQEYGAYEVVKDVGQRRMSSGWIITQKVYGNVIGAKARLVVHGNQEHGHLVSDSPTVSKQSLRLQFSLAAQFGWEIVMADVTSAFLQSDILDREIYVQPPEGCAPPGTLWLLRKPMYGLEDASLKWYKTLEDRLIGLGCTKMTLDPAMFVWKDKTGKLGGIIAWHVDDMVACGSDEFYEKVLLKLMKMFTFGSTSEGKYRCLGWNVEHTDDEILVSQSDYIETKLEFLNINTKKNLGITKLGSEDATKARGMIGKLRWLADQSRPDIAYNLLELSIQSHSPTYDTVKLINKTVAQVMNRDYQIKFNKLRSRQWYISVFSDASLKGLPDKTSSAMGYVILLSEGFKAGERRACNILSWKSCKTKRITASTYDAETLSLSTALEEAVFIKELMTRMLGTGQEEILIEAWCDCNDSVSAIIANKPLTNQNNRLAALEIARIKEMRELKMIDSINWCPSVHQLADVLTKRGASNEAIIHTAEQGKFFY